MYFHYESNITTKGINKDLRSWTLAVLRSSPSNKFFKRKKQSKVSTSNCKGAGDPLSKQEGRSKTKISTSGANQIPLSGGGASNTRVSDGKSENIEGQTHVCLDFPCRRALKPDYPKPCDWGHQGHRHQPWPHGISSMVLHTYSWFRILVLRTVLYR